MVESNKSVRNADGQCSYCAQYLFIHRILTKLSKSELSKNIEMYLLSDAEALAIWPLDMFERERILWHASS
jgi:hypothetical protein